MKIEVIQSPFSAHNNLLFTFAKLFLIDSNIYDTSNEALPYTDKSRKYKLRVSDIDKSIIIKHNDIPIINYPGTVSTLDFYVNPVLGSNEFGVTDSSGNSECYVIMNCYNIHSFLAFMAYKFKQQWNGLYQALANRFIVDSVFDDLDGNWLSPEYNISKDWARLFGTSRYSKFTDAQYFTFLHALNDIHNAGGKYLSLYKLQQALPDYISKVDIQKLEEYQPQHNKLLGKVYYDGTDGVKIYPGYTFQESNDWGLLPYLERYQVPNTFIGVSDSTSDYSQWVITNGSLYTDSTNWGSLQVIGSSLVYIPGLEPNVTDSFTALDIYTDGTDGTYTGFAGSKFVTLRNPVSDSSSISIVSVAPVTVENSFRYVPDYNLVDLGTMYSDGTINVSYRTFSNYGVLARLNVDGSQIIAIEKSGKEDKHYLSYRDDEYGTVVIIVKGKKYIDLELRKIISDIVKYVIPAHIKYYIVYTLTGIWDYAGQTDVTLDEIENANATNVVWSTLESAADKMYTISQNGDYGIAAGETGSYYFTDDNWVNSTIGSLTSETLLSGNIDKADNIVVVGTGGSIFTSTDYSVTWNDYSNVLFGDVNNVVFVSDYTRLGLYYACTSTGLVLKSQTNGRIWYKYQVGTDLKTIDFVDRDRGITADISGKLYITYDGETYTELVDLGVQINSIKYLDPQTIIAAGINYIYTVKFGDNYDTPLVTETNLAIQESFNKIDVYDLNRLYVVGDSGTIMKSLDRGNSWSDIIVPDVFDYTSVSIKSKTEFLVTTDEAKLIRITMDDIFYEPIKLENLL